MSTIEPKHLLFSKDGNTYNIRSGVDKADKVANATTGNFAGLDSNGNLTDSGYAPSDFDQEAVIDDTAGDGDTDKTWSADKLTAEFVKKVGGNGRVFYGTDSDVLFGYSVDSCNFMVSNFDEPVTGDIFVISGMKDRYNRDLHPLYAFFNATQSGVTYQQYEIRTVSGSQIPVNERNFSQNSANIFVYNGTYLLLVGASHASTATYGLTKLVNSSTSSSTTTALVPAALKSVVDSRITPLEASVAGLIDDTAGTGDTDKTWSADKIAEELSSFDPDIIDDTAGDGDTDKTWSADKLVETFDASKLVTLIYGTSTWNDFINAYNAQKIVYCRVGGRMAFMAYVNNDGVNPTEVEFQYYRSIATHTATDQGDEVYVYKLTSAGTWTTTTRKAFTKIVNGTYLNQSYSNGALTLNVNLTSQSAAAGGTDVSLVTTGEKATWNGKLDSSEKGAANGVASLDSTGKVSSSQLPAQANVIDDTAGDGDTDKAWSADKLVAEFAAKASVNDLTLYCTCQTAASEQVKVATVASTSAPGPITLRRGMMIGVMYRYTNTYVPTSQAPVQLNLAGTGAVSIRTGSLLPGGGANPDVYGREMEVTYYMYDGSFWTWMGCDSIPDTIVDIKDGKADKVANATSGNLAALDANGNIVDSGYAPSDFDPSGIIDDTAGEGDTDKAWSADKLTGEFENVRDGAVAVKTIDTPAEVMSFDNGSRFPMSLGVSVTAEQDLHGYDKPWVDGGGKNLFDCTISNGSVTNAGITYTNVKDADNNVIGVTSSGTATGYSQCNIDVTLPAGTYRTRVDGNDATKMNMNVRKGSSWFADPNTTFTLSEQTTIRIRYFVDYNNGVYSGGNTIKVSLYVYDGTEQEFTPYSNICPITGWDGAKVSVAGENFFTGTIEQGTISSSGVKGGSNNRIRSAGFMELEPGQYTLYANETLACGIFFYQLDETFIERDAWHETPYTFTVTAKQKVAFIFAKDSSGSAPDIVPSDATNVGVYAERTIYQISFPSEAGTVYGGTLAVNADGTGTLVVTHGCVTENDFDVATGISSGGQHYAQAKSGIELPPANSPGLCNMLVQDNGGAWQRATPCFQLGFNSKSMRVYGSFTSSSEFITQYEGLQIVYPLTTPVTYTLTPGQVLSVLGKNHVWADCGQILSLDYETNASRIYDAANGLANTARQETADLAEGMAIVVDGDTAPKAITSGQYLFIKNHSTLATGGYHATANIASGASVTSSNVSADTDGIANALFNNFGLISSGLTPTNCTIIAGGYYKVGKLVIVGIRVRPSSGVTFLKITGFPPYTNATGNVNTYALSWTNAYRDGISDIKGHGYMNREGNLVFNPDPNYLTSNDGYCFSVTYICD